MVAFVMVTERSAVLALTASGRQARPALWVVVGLMFLVVPAVTLALTILWVWSRPTTERHNLSLVLLLGALYLALVNVTKLPESDLAVYLDAFADAQHMDLPAYLLLNTREPLYYISLHFLANLPGMDGRIFVFLSTVVPYLVFGTAVLRLGMALKLNSRALLSLLIFLLFFAQLFSLSAHLFRQFLASSLVMLFLADQAITGRKRWGLGLLSIMVHYSSIPLLLLSLVKPLKRYSGLVSIFFQAIFLIAIYILAVQVAPFLSGLPVLGIIFERLANSEGAALNALNLPALGTATLFLALSLFSLIRTTDKTLAAQDWSVLLCTITICVIVLLSSTQATLTEIATRYFFYLYFLIGLVLLFLMARVPQCRLVVHTLALLSLPSFFYKLAYGEWTFAPLGSLLFGPTWMLWSYQSSGLT